MFCGQKKTLQDFSCKVNFSVMVFLMGFAPNHKINIYYLALIAACAAARRAIGTRYGEQDT